MSQKKTKTQGLETWINPKNKFACVRLHYTADPAKRTDEWREQAKFGMTAKAWATEFELKWEVYAGEPVYGAEFNRTLHVFDSVISPNEQVPLLFRGWDFGGNHSCVVAQYVDGHLDILKEYANVGFNTRRIAQDIQEDCAITYGDHYRWVEFIDPSGLHEGKTSTGMACADVMRELGMTVHPGEQDPTRRIDAVMKMLVTMKSGRPMLKMNPTCRMLISGFEGGYHYPETEKKNQKMNRPEKNDHSHIHDATQYLCTRISSFNLVSSGVFSAFDGTGARFKFNG